MGIGRRCAAAGAAAGAVLLAAAPAAAHGVGGRVDLPIPVWQFAWAAALAVAASFGVLSMFWTSPRLAAAARGRPLPARLTKADRPLLLLTRTAGLSMLGILLYAGLGGSRDTASNIAPYAVFIIFWVGVSLGSALAGDIWKAFNPFHTLADLGAWLRAHLTGAPMSAPDRGAGNQWWAAGAVFTFVWMELAFHAGAAPRSVGVYLAAYTAAMLAGAAVWGRGWVRDADGFGALFTILSAMAPFYRSASGRWRVRPPLAGLARLEVRPGAVRLILIVLGAAAFDGFTRSSFWLDIASNRSGWMLTALNTGGLLFGIGVMMAVYRTAAAAMARITGDPEDELGDAFGPSLVPITAAYTAAHYFSFLVLDGQAVIRLASDPFGMGWDMFGAAGYRIDYTLVPAAAVAWIQTAAIAAGHMLGVAAAHDRAVERYRPDLAVRSQYPMLAAMIAYTIAGLLLLLGG